MFQTPGVRYSFKGSILSFDSPPPPKPEAAPEAAFTPRRSPPPAAKLARRGKKSQHVLEFNLLFLKKGNGFKRSLNWKNIHYRLLDMLKQEGVSMNRFVQ